MSEVTIEKIEAPMNMFAKLRKLYLQLEKGLMTPEEYLAFVARVIEEAK